MILRRVIGFLAVAASAAALITVPAVVQAQLLTGELAMLTSPDAAASDYFGDGVAVDGDTLVVGSQGDDEAGSAAGAAFVYQRDRGGVDNWGLVAKLTASNAYDNDCFGRAVAIDGDTIVVGAPRKSGGGGYSYRGAAYVFERHLGGTDAWGERTSIDNPTPYTYDEFGESVSISGDTAVIGAWRDDSEAGSAFVFDRDQGGSDSWGMVKKLAPTGRIAWDHCGESVSISLDTVIVGCPGDDDGGNASGSAFIFERDLGGASNWGQRAKLIASDDMAGDQFGMAVAIGGDTAVIGSPYDDYSSTDCGSVTFFGRDQGGADTWGQINKRYLTGRQSYDRYGMAVGFDGVHAVAGADFYDYWDEYYDNKPGKAAVLEFTGTYWAQVCPLSASDGEDEDRFGHDVGISGDIVVIGARGNDDDGSNSGSAYVYGVADQPDPLRVFTVTAGDGETILEWVNSRIGYSSTIIRSSTTATPTGPTDGDPVYSGSDGGAGGSASTPHSSLTNGDTYHYAAFVSDGGSLYSTAATADARPQSTSGAVKWIYSTGATSLAPPAVRPGVAHYAVSNDQLLHAVAADVGGGLWPSGFVPPSMNAPAQGRGPVLDLPTTTIGGASAVALVGSQDQRVYAFNAATGAQLWVSPELEGEVQAAPAAMFTDFGAPFSLVVACTRNTAGDSRVYGLDPADGSIAWTLPNSGSTAGLGLISSQPSIDRSGPTVRLYFGSRSGGSTHTVWCIAFTASSASYSWSVDIGNVSGSPIYWNGVLYVGNDAGSVYAFDGATGDSRWSGPYVTGDGAVNGWVWTHFTEPRLFFTTDSAVHAIIDNGAGTSPASFWSSPVSVSNPSAPLLHDDIVYVGGGDGKLWQIAATAGTPAVTSLVLGDPASPKAISSPAMDVSTTTSQIVVGSEEGRIYLVEVPLPWS